MSQIKSAIKDLIFQVIDLVGGVRGASVDLRIQGTQVVLSCDLAEGTGPVKPATGVPASENVASGEHGERIKAELADRPLSLKALAERLGVSPKSSLKPVVRKLIREGVIEKAGPAFRLVTGVPRRRGRPPMQASPRDAAPPASMQRTAPPVRTKPVDRRRAASEPSIKVKKPKPPRSATTKPVVKPARAKAPPKPAPFKKKPATKRATGANLSGKRTPAPVRVAESEASSGEVVSEPAGTGDGAADTMVTAT